MFKDIKNRRVRSAIMIGLCVVLIPNILSLDIALGVLYFYGLEFDSSIFLSLDGALIIIAASVCWYTDKNESKAIKDVLQ
jgi:hypothetical protein